MENQVNIGGQNSQQMGANRANQLMEIRPKPKVNYWIVSTVIFAVLFFGMVGFYLIKTQELEEETNISILPTVVSTGTPMLLPTVSELNWKMYKNEEFGYRIQYPFDRTVYEDPDGATKYDKQIVHVIYMSSIPYPLSSSLVYKPSEVRVFILAFYKNINGLELEDFVKETLLPGGKSIQLTEKSYPNFTGLYYDEVGMDNKIFPRFAVKKGNYVIIFSGTETDEGAKILSTFEFTK